ncbi:hypothetical protein GLAREA_05993 [Glarea lozoyensis ATCC 20868]|uniref:Uncharacterized protein n=1 Tax=Glarea lozoyensis (strain ATCC 20868 / MF5171) TaxID=1116229 RepID=S3DLP7_GLAL2|nr:uncharacterized protein GLAREA_05993 [Glarea lozoyensis ATCC 20868]EPE32981.1 hypothetical protein GLAREA_05993 [Glarea lozoyensis ATCC 20868]
MAPNTDSHKMNEESVNHLPKPISLKAELNISILDRLQAAITTDPEVSLFAIFPIVYKTAVAAQKKKIKTAEALIETFKRYAPPDFCAN